MCTTSAGSWSDGRHYGDAVVRIGVLGAAKIAPNALVRPANAEPRASVVAVAARDPIRAEAFAEKWHIPTVHRTYQDLLDDPGIDAVYNPLPNGLHGHWTMAAIDAGKHVLCEKPFTANAEEARAVAARAQASDRVVMEAFHWRYHPMAERTIELVRSGAIGELQSVRASFCFPLLSSTDIRWALELAGGALMDAGCYPVHMVRSFVGAEPEVTSARAWLKSPGVDRLMEAELRFPGDVSGFIRASLWSRHLLAISAQVVGTDGSISLLNPLAPQYLSRLVVRDGAGRRREAISKRATYSFQMAAFCDAVEDGVAPITGVEDSVANMAVIDDIYRAAGLDPRRPSDVGGAT